MPRKPRKPDNENFRANLLVQQIRRQGRAGRLELARRFHISNSRVCDLIQDRLDRGLLIEELGGPERRGRRGVPVMLNPKYGHIVGFDMEAKRLRMVAVDFAGKVVWQSQQRLQPATSRPALIDAILRFVDRGLTEIRPRCRNLVGMGIAANGIVDVRHGVVLHYDLVPVARDLPLRELIASRTGLTCCMEDNIRALTLAEWMSGAAQHLDSFVCVAVRSGIGAGIVINNQLYTGSHGFGGEVGYMPIARGSSVGQWKHLQHVVSEHALGVDVEAADFKLPEGRARRAGELLGAQLAGVASLLDPDAMVLAGGLVQPDRPLWGPMVSTFRRLVLPELVERVQLLPAQLGPFAAAVGATHRCFQMLFPVEPDAR
jgi:predicted NBD/HSP70 family sugar kinase